MNSDFAVAVHAMVFLYHKAQTVSSEKLAENICTNPVRVRRVMAKLKKAGLVETREGRTDGGYSVSKAKAITLRDIGEALDVEFTGFSWRSGDIDKPCLIASGMSKYMDGLYSELNRRCKEYLGSITIADVEQTLTKKEKENGYL